MVLPADDQGTFPQLPLPAASPVPDKPAGFVPSGLDRTTRLAGVVVSWGVLQHFYPYLEQVGADWPGALDRALTATAVDPDEAAYVRTLRRLLVELEDGHARVLPVTLPVRFAFTADSIDADVHVTFVDHFEEPISGRTKWARDDDWWIIDADIVLAVHHRSGRVLDEDSMKAMALHETGHLLGLDHTDDQTSIMAPRVRVRSLSAADRATVRLLYTLPPGGVR